MLPALQNPPYDTSGDYSVVYTWGVTGIAYNTKYIKDTPRSWNDLWKDEYKGRVILLNDNREVIGMGLKKDGHSVNSKDPAEVTQAVGHLHKLIPNLLAFDTDTIKQKFIAEEAWIGTMWSGDASLPTRIIQTLPSLFPKKAPSYGRTPLPSPKERNTKNWRKLSSITSMIRRSARKITNTSATTTPTPKRKPIIPKNITEIPC